MKLHPPRRGRWLDIAAPSLTPEQKHWLFRPGALTAGLRQLGRVDLSVLREFSDGLRATEAWMLGLAPGSPVWVREIIMSINGVDSVTARSFTPLRASHGCWQGMRRLRAHPLADMLYHDPKITRSRFFACRLIRQQPLYRTVDLAMGAATPPPHRLLARCSVFWHQGQPLLVAECFLPDFWRLAAGGRAACPDPSNNAARKRLRQ